MHVSVVAVFCRNLLLCQQIPLVACVNEMAAIFFIETILPAVNQGQHCARVLFCKRFQRIQAVPVTGQSHRHHRNTLQIRQIFYQLLNAVFQLFTVVDTFAEHNLTVHNNARLIETIHLFEGVPGEAVMKHLTAKLRVHGLEGNINRLHAVGDDALYILVTHIGKGHIIALQKRKPGIIVLEIQGIPHALRQLIDKTEDTFIAAGTIIVHHAIFKLDA